MVVVGRSVRADGVDSVMTDEQVGARLVVDHLAKLGHQRIVHVDGGRGAGAAPRRQGYRKAMERRGLGRFIEILAGDFTERAGTEAAAALVRRRSLPTAVFAANDLVAVGAIETLERNGHEVPGAVSVVGYDNTFFARLQHVSLTTVDQPREEMGRIALQSARRSDDRAAASAGARADHADARHPQHDRPTAVTPWRRCRDRCAARPRGVWRRRPIGAGRRMSRSRRRAAR